MTEISPCPDAIINLACLQLTRLESEEQRRDEELPVASEVSSDFSAVRVHNPNKSSVDEAIFKVLYSILYPFSFSFFNCTNNKFIYKIEFLDLDSGVEVDGSYRSTTSLRIPTSDAQFEKEEQRVEDRSSELICTSTVYGLKQSRLPKSQNFHLSYPIKSLHLFIRIITLSSCSQH